MSYKSNIWKMNLFLFLRGLQFFVGVLVPFFMNWGKLSFSQIMFLEAFFVVFVFVFEIPSGAFADRFGRKTSLILAALANAIAVLVYSTYPNFYIFLVGEIFWALSIALLSGPSDALVYDTLKAEKREKESKKILGRYRSFELIGIVVAAPLGSVIADAFGLRFVMVFTAIPLIFAFFLGFSLKEPPYKGEKKETFFELIKNGLKYFKNHKILRVMTIDRVVVYAFVFAFFWSHQVILEDINVPLKYFGWVVCLMTLIEVFILNYLEDIDRWMGKKTRLILITGLLPGIGALLIAFLQMPVLIIPLLIITLGFGFSRDMVFMNYMNKHIESHNRSTVLSVISMVKSIVFTIVLLGFGYLVEWNLYASLAIIGTFMIVTTILSGVKEKHLLD